MLSRVRVGLLREIGQGRGALRAGGEGVQQGGSGDAIRVEENR